MDIQGKTVLVLGGWGLVGSAICRKFMEERPRRIIVTSLNKAEAMEAVEALQKDFPRAGKNFFVPWWGNIFVREELKDIPREEIIGNEKYRSMIIEDIVDELTGPVMKRSSAAPPSHAVQAGSRRGLRQLGDRDRLPGHLPGVTRPDQAGPEVTRREEIESTAGLRSDRCGRTPPLHPVHSAAYPARPDHVPLHAGSGDDHLCEDRHQRHRRHGTEHSLHAQRGTPIAGPPFQIRCRRRSHAPPLPDGTHPRRTDHQGDQTDRRNRLEAHRRSARSRNGGSRSRLWTAPWRRLWNSGGPCSST